MPYDIVHNSGTTTVVRDQRSQGGVWVSLGIYSFNAGQTSSVTVRTTNTVNFVVADAVRFTPVLDTPTQLQANAATTSTISLSWQDNAVNEDGYNIERSPNGTSWTQIAHVQISNLTSYYDNGLTANTTYYYRVRAFGTNLYSLYSNQASAKNADPGTSRHYRGQHRHG